MSTTSHTTKTLCPICSVTFLKHVHCALGSCTFVVTTCPECDKKQAVDAFVADHQKDCVHAPSVPQPTTARFHRVDARDAA